MFTEELADTEFKQRLSDIQPGLDLPAEPVLSADIRQFALLSVANCPTARALTLRNRIVIQVELHVLKETFASELNISDAEFRESIQIQPGFVLPEGSDIPLIARAYSLKLLRTEPEIEVKQMIKQTCREIYYDVTQRTPWRGWRLSKM